MENINKMKNRDGLYASVIGTKGNLVKLRKANQLSRIEEKKFDKVLSSLDDLHKTIRKNNTKDNKKTFMEWLRLAK